MSGSRWRIEGKGGLVAYTAIGLLLLLLVYPALTWLVRSWLSNPYYSHGFLVPLIAAFLAWREWPNVLAEPRREGSRLGLILLLVGLAAAVWSLRWQNYGPALLALLVLSGGLALYLEGWPRLRHLLFPLAFLALAVPLPFVDRFSPWMEAFTARSATALARLAGLDVVQRGGEIALPGTTVMVGAPCSGLRSLVAMITVGVGWVYVVQGRWWAKGLMLAAVLPLVALSNVLRIAALLWVAVTWGAEVALSYYHDWSSPLLFLLALALLLLLGKVLGCSRVRDDLFS